MPDLGELKDVMLARPGLAHERVSEGFKNMRYHISFPPEMEPSELLLGTIAREINRRRLSVKDVWAVVTMAMSRGRPTPVKDYGNGLFATVDDEHSLQVSGAHTGAGRGLW